MNFQRQSDIIDTDKLETIPILIVGGGSIGSYTTLALTKMGARRIKVIDFDELEDHNIPNQFYKTSDVGKIKVEALRDNIIELTGVMIAVENRRFEDNDVNFLEESGIGIAATDNMAARKQFYEALVKSGAGSRYIDARMASLSLEIFNINPHNEDDRKLYESKLFDDKDALQVPCTARGIVFPVMTCASLTSNMVLNHVMEHESRRRYIMDYSKDMFITEA